MKAYKYEIVIIDHEEVGQEEIIGILKSSRHINPIILSQGEAEIGQWSDEHPANKRESFKDFFERIFD